MKFDLTHKGAVLSLIHGNQLELDTMAKYASASYYSYHNRKTYEITYLKLFQFVMSGLWHKMMSISKVTGIPVEINGLIDKGDEIGIIDPTVTREYLEDWIDSHNFRWAPRWYQFESVYYALKYRLSRCEVATAGGKSFMIFLYCRNLIERGIIKEGDKILIITIRRLLVTQLVEDFQDYESTDPVKLLKCDTVFSGGRKLKHSNIVVGTYQTLSNYDEDYFTQFGAIIIDECHQAHIKSIRDDIIPKLDLDKCKYRFGLSGTQPLAGTPEDLHLEAYMGPTLFKIGAADLQKEGAIAQIKINQIQFNYSRETSRSLYFAPEMASDKISTSLLYERRFIQQYERRNMVIKNIVDKFNGNQVVLVENVDYATYLKDLFKTIEGKQSYVIHGGTKDKVRDKIKSLFKEADNLVLVATYETMSTGVSINNIHAVHFPDGGKSRIRMRQSCGRGLRLHPSKEYLTVFDYLDKLSKPSTKERAITGEAEWPGPFVNRLFNQGRARYKIYEGEKFPIKSITYNL